MPDHIMARYKPTGSPRLIHLRRELTQLEDDRKLLGRGLDMCRKMDPGINSRVQSQHWLDP